MRTNKSNRQLEPAILALLGASFVVCAEEIVVAADLPATATYRERTTLPQDLADIEQLRARKDNDANG
jgi:hypothetical protein